MNSEQEKSVCHSEKKKSAERDHSESAVSC
jgi:hypothetical protein